MTIPSRQIGQDPISQQLWRISKQIDKIIQGVCPCTTTTSTTSTTSTSTTSSTTSTTTTDFPV